MACKITMSLLTEGQEGNVGDDWKYTLEAKLYDEGLTGEGSISVPKHKLGAGITQSCYGPPEPVSINAGECSANEVRVALTLVATEVDWLINESGTNSMTITVPCPGPGADPLTTDLEMSTGVRESPSMIDKTAIFKLKIRLVAEWD